MICGVNSAQKKSFYRNRLAPALQHQFDLLVEASREEILDLIEEIQLLRQVAGDAAELYSHATVKSDRSASMVLHSSHLMREALNDVVQAVAVIKKIDKATPKFDKIFINHIADIVGNIVPTQYIPQIHAELMNLSEEYDNPRSSFCPPPDRTALLMDLTVPTDN